LVSEEIKATLEQVAEKYEVKLEEVLENFQQLVDERGFDEKRAANVAGAMARRKSISKTTDFVGIILGMGECRDSAETMRRIARKRYAEDPVRAISEGFVNEDGQPIDNREGWRTKGKAIPEKKKELGRTIRGYARPEAGGEAKPFILYMNQNATAALEPKMFTWLKFNVHDKTEEKKDKARGGYYLTSSKYTEFVPMEIDADPNDVIADYFDNATVLTLSELAPTLEEARQQGRKSAYVTVRGMVESVNMEPDGLGLRTIQLYDLDLDSEVEDNFGGSVRCRVPTHIPINFGQWSEVHVMGLLKRGDRRDEENENVWHKGEGGLEIATDGVWANPEFQMDMPDSGSVEKTMDALDTQDLEELE
jgi:hypothetical protein